MKKRTNGQNKVKAIQKQATRQYKLDKMKMKAEPKMNANKQIQRTARMALVTDALKTKYENQASNRDSTLQYLNQQIANSNTPSKGTADDEAIGDTNNPGKKPGGKNNG